MTTLGELPSDIAPHVLRHSFASLAADFGYSDASTRKAFRAQAAIRRQTQGERPRDFP